MKTRKKSHTEFANYLRENISKPADWDENLFGKFPGTPAMYQKYFGYILEKGENLEKIEAIESQYGLKKDFSLDKKIEIIDGRPRSIYNYFKNGTVPHEANLKFIATVFDFPLKTIEEYIEFVNKNISENENTTQQQIRPLKKSKLIAISLVVLVFIVFSGIYLKKIFADNQAPSEMQNNKLSYPSVMPKNAGDSIFISKTPNPDADLSLDTIVYQTIYICNDELIYKEKDNWSFETDPKGEDMSSEYGGEFGRDIYTIFPTLRGITKIANQRMVLRFTITNFTEKSVSFSGLKVTIEDTHDAVAEKAKYNLYQHRAEEVSYEIKFNPKQNGYSILTQNETIEAGATLTCDIDFTGTDDCEGRIFEFYIVADILKNEKGKLKKTHVNVRSDKNYFLGFKKQ